MRRWFCLLGMLLLVLPASAQPDDVSALTDQFDALVPALLESSDVPGAALALIHNGEIVWSSGYGAADLAENIPVTAETPFSVESIGKALTAWEIMRLVEAGEIDLDTPVDHYLTRWHVNALGRNDPDDVTIRRILSHTAGLSVDGYRGLDAETELPTTEAFLDGAISGERVQVVVSPGRRFMYSGGGYTILQLMIEELTGGSFEDVMQRDVLDPLGMTNSRFQWSPALNAATAYTASGDVDAEVLHADLAAGGLYASALDLARFLTGGLHGDWLTPESVTLMYTPAEATRDGYGYGYFLFTLADGTSVAWHDGIGIGTRTIFFLLPESDDGLIILTNKATGNRIFRDVVCAWDSWLHAEQTALCQSY